MAKRPKKPEPEDLKDAEFCRKRLGRREFVKLVGGTGMAVSATGVLAGAAILPEIAEAAAGEVVGPGAVPITLRINGQETQSLIGPDGKIADAEACRPGKGRGCCETV